MSARNRQRREDNRLTRVSLENDRRRSVHRIWAAVAFAVLALPATAFAITKASSDSPKQVVVESPAAAEATTTVPPASPRSTAATPPAKPRTKTTVPTRTVYRTITRTQQVPVPVPVPAGQTQAQVTPQTRIVQIPQSTTTTRPVAPVSKPCVASTETLPGGGTVPVRVGPAPTTLYVRDLVTGTGEVVKPHAKVTVDYVAVLCSTGKIVDATFKQGSAATIDLDQLIAGWQQGLPGARVGGTRLLGVPASLAYGLAGRPPQIPGNEALWFQIKVIATGVTLGPPGAPTNVHATPGAAKATLTWTAPATNGAPITQYKISRYANGALEGQQTVYTTASDITVSGLTPGKSYTFKMSAQNSYGAGPDSALSNAVIPT